MTRILITGASGFLGHNLGQVLCRRHEVFAGFCANPPDNGAWTPVQFDVTKAGDVSAKIEQARPDLLIHSAAISQPDECEHRPELARDVIVTGTQNVADGCRRNSVRLLHISTDLVFDGRRGWYTEEDEVHAISVYSNTKIEAEKVARDAVPSSTILRVALLFGIGSSSHQGSIVSILRSWREGRVLTFYTDQYRTPTYAPQVAEVVERLLEKPDVRGVFHLGGADRVSRFEFAARLAEKAGIAMQFLRPGSMFDSQAVAPRGVDCSLVSKKIEEVIGVRPLHCREALDLMEQQGIFQSE